MGEHRHYYQASEDTGQADRVTLPAHRNLVCQSRSSYTTGRRPDSMLMRKITSATTSSR